MTTPIEEPKSVEPQAVEAGAAPVAPAVLAEQDERKRRLLLLLLLVLLVILCAVCGLTARYLMKPEPLPQMLLPTQVSVCYQPVYKFSINNISGPVAVALSPSGDRIYVAEGAGDRFIKIFDRDGGYITSFAPPGTDRANREPKYMAVDPQGRVYVVDRTSDAIDIYDRDGKFLDAIIGQHMTLTKYLTEQIGPIPAGTVIVHYEGINRVLSYRVPDEPIKSVKIVFPDDEPAWNPLGLRFDSDGNLIYTDTTITKHSVHIIPAAALTGDLSAFNPDIVEFGSQGPSNDQFDFPQVVVKDGKGNFYISDGNNSRIVAWTPDFTYKTFFGFGSTQGALNLPRGMWMATGDCLVVADAVGGLLRVYDVSGDEPQYAFDLGAFGFQEGEFNYPVDVYIDGTGRLYIADRSNNRVQIWSY